MRQNCNNLLSPSLIVDRKASFSTALFLRGPAPPSMRNGVNCATLKVWISSGQAPLMTVGTQEKGFLQIERWHDGQISFKNRQAKHSAPASLLLNRSALVVCNAFTWCLPLLMWKCCKDAESVQKITEAGAVLNTLCSCSHVCSRIGGSDQ